MDKTIKRSISFVEIKRIKDLDLSRKPIWDYARDMFIFSFCTRGMSFVDMAYLKKKDLRNGYLTYRRKKTGQLLIIEWTRQMQDILDKYEPNKTKYLLPIIMREDGNENKQTSEGDCRLGQSVSAIVFILQPSQLGNHSTRQGHTPGCDKRRTGARVGSYHPDIFRFD